jgi:cell division topological specificity factor
VIAKYVQVKRDQVSVNLERIGDSAVLELNITMPEETLEEA